MRVDIIGHSKHAWSILAETAETPMEFFIGLQSVIWGLWAILVGLGGAHQVLLYLFPTQVWGAVALFIGVLKLWVSTNGYVFVRRLGLFVSFIFWMFIGLTVYLFDPDSFNASIYIFVALMALWAYYLLGSRRKRKTHE